MYKEFFKGLYFLSRILVLGIIPKKTVKMIDKGY